MAIGGFRICLVTWECRALRTFGDFFGNLWKVLWLWSLIIGGHFIWHYPGSLKLFSDAIFLVVCSYSGAGAVSPSLSSIAPLASPAPVSSAGWVFPLTQLLPFLDSAVSVGGCVVLGLQGNNWVLKLKLGGGFCVSVFARYLCNQNGYLTLLSINTLHPYWRWDCTCCSWIFHFSIFKKQTNLAIKFLAPLYHFLF